MYTNLKTELLCLCKKMEINYAICYHVLLMGILLLTRKYADTTQEIKVISMYLNVKVNLFLIGPKIWNDLPDNLKQANSLSHQFKEDCN